MPKVSVIISTYNRHHYVCEAIDSVLTQTFKDFEIILVDDGSKDNTKEVLERYSSSIRYVYQKNKGRAEARNTGIKIAQGEYIAFLDDDDIWLPNKLEKQVIFLDSNPDIGLVHTFTEIIDEHGNPQEEETKNRLRQYEKSLFLGYTYEGISRCGIMFMSSVMLRKLCLEKTGLFDPNIEGHEDWDFSLRFALRYRIGTLLEPLVKYRIHQIQTALEKLTRGRIKVAMKHLVILDSLDNLLSRNRIQYNFYIHLINAHYINMQLTEFQTYALKAIKLNPLILFRSRLVIHLLLSLMPIRIIGLLRQLKNKPFKCRFSR